MKKKKGKYKWGSRIGMAFLVLILIGSIAWVYRSNLTMAKLKFQVVETGTIKHEITVEAIFANEEVLIKSSQTGKIKFTAEEGHRFRKGDILAEVSPEGISPGSINKTTRVNIISPTSGLFYKETDGLENVYDSNNLVNMDISKLLLEQENRRVPDTSVSTGECIGKIVNNLLPTSAFFEVKTIDELKVGQNLRFSIEDQQYVGKILRKTQEPKGVVVEFNQFVLGSVNKRKQQVIWKLRPEITGTVIPKSALWNQGEEQGVLLISEGVIKFRKINILDENETEICTKDVVSGVSIITNPRSGLEGLIATNI